MKSYTTIHLTIAADDEQARDVIATVAMIETGEAAWFIDELAASLGPIIGLHFHAARELIGYHVGEPVTLAVPECFGLSIEARQKFAREVAGSIAFHFRQRTAA